MWTRLTLSHGVVVGVVVASLAACSGSRSTESRGPSAVTLVIRNGRIWTGNTAKPRAQALAVAGDRILAVGRDREILSLAGDGTRVIDVDGRRVLPGFIDSHVHLLSGGDELLAPDLRSARSVEELGRRLAAAAAEVPEGTWLTSGAWDHENWPGGKLPGREVLDGYVPGHPVFVSRIDGHMAVGNSLALEIAGVSRATADPPGGTIIRDASGEPTGVLKDAAMALVARHVPPWTAAERLERVRAALRHAAALGVTAVHDMGSTHDAITTYQVVRDRGELTARIFVYTPIAGHERWAAVGFRRGFGDRFLTINGVKAFADGSLGSSTALFFEPYVGDPENTGLARDDLSAGGRLERRVGACVRRGLQVAVHGIGDRAVRSLLDIYERVGRGDRELRFRIEHAQHVHPDDLGRFGELGVVASMQPYHCIDDGRWAERRIGTERCETSYAFRDLLDRGAVVAFGSDWPVAPLSPLEGIHAAVTRETLNGAHPGGWVPRQKIEVEEALRAYTAGAAYAAFAERETGSLERGKLADMVVLDRDILALEDDAIRDSRVLMTIVDGRLVHYRLDRSGSRSGRISTDDRR